jgi:putative transcriptional regulator
MQEFRPAGTTSLGTVALAMPNAWPFCVLWRMDQFRRRMRFDTIAIAFNGHGISDTPAGRLAKTWPADPAGGLCLADHGYVVDRCPAGCAPALPMNNRIREFRLARGCSQGALADALHVSRQTVNAIENGRYDSSLPPAFSIATLLPLTIEKIFRL